MAEQKLLVKREGDFHYPIYFKNDFQDLAGAIREPILHKLKQVHLSIFILESPGI